MAANTVEYIIQLTDKFTPVIKKTQKSLKGMSHRIKRLKKDIQSMNNLNLAIGGAVFVGGIMKSIKAFNLQEAAIANVRQGLASTNNVSGRTLEQLQKQAVTLQKTGIFGDEDILQNATAQLLTFTNIAGQQFDKAQQAAVDVTAKLYGVNASGEQLRTTSIMLGKALNDPVANLGALSRSGIQFSKQQKEVIKTLTESGNIAQAQTLILQELQKQYGGTAEALNKTFAGRMKQLNMTIGDVVEKIGGALVPILTPLINVFSSVANVLDRNKEVLQFIIPPLAALVGTIFGVIAVFKAWTLISGLLNLSLLANPVFLVVAGIIALATAFVTLWNKSERFRGAILGTWQVMKDFYSFIKNKFLKIFDTLSNMTFRDFAKSIGKWVIGRIKNLLTALKGVGKAIQLLFKGQFKAAAKEAANSASLLITNRTLEQNIKTAKNLGKKTSKAFNKGFEQGKEAEKITAPTGVTPTVTGDIGGLAGLDAKKAGENVVSSGGIKQFNVNIASITGVETLQSSNIKESANRIGKLINQAILNELADLKVT